jgi:hypothetical protein
MKKIDDNHVKVFYDRTVEPEVTVRDALHFILSKYRNVHTKPLVPVQQGKYLLYIDGLHEGDADLNNPHHYLSTNGGYDSPQGESARHASLVVLDGWSKVALDEALNKLSVDFLDPDIYEERKDVGEINGSEERNENLDVEEMVGGDDDRGIRIRQESNCMEQ